MKAHQHVHTLDQEDHKKDGEKKGTVYTCPMHPEVKSDKPGKCPKCGMDLVKQGKQSEHKMIHEEHGNMPEMIRDMRRPWLWTNSMLIMLGLWLISSPFTFEYESSPMIWSDVISGLLLAAFAGISFMPRYDFLGRWGAAFVGAWLQFAPLIFWAPTSVAYVTDTLIGALAIAFSVLVPMMPGMAHHMEMMKPGPEIPPGWTYNPSTWHQRAPMMIAAFLGWIISRFLAAYQLGYIETIWEPFFGDGTVSVLTSDVSKSWPISDAGLGATAYTFEMLMAWMGGVTRWRTMPWMVTFFFILVVPLGVTSIVLVILQPVAVGAWCTLCLLTALIMLIMIPFTVDEVVAMIQFMKRSTREGKSPWRTFWVGGTLNEENKDERTPQYGASLSDLTPAGLWGVNAPWNLLISAVLGLWLMFAPYALGFEDSLADSDHLIGALIITFSVIAMAEVVRYIRFLNIFFGAWLIIAPWVLEGGTNTGNWNDVIVGVLLISLSFPKGKIKEKYGTYNSVIF
ncbi:MAG: SPW repeat domain-containing protein [Bacteroidota bacterium]